MGIGYFVFYNFWSWQALCILCRLFLQTYCLETCKKPLMYFYSPSRVLIKGEEFFFLLFFCVCLTVYIVYWIYRLYYIFTHCIVCYRFVHMVTSPTIESSIALHIEKWIFTQQTYVRKIVDIGGKLVTMKSVNLLDWCFANA